MLSNINEIVKAIKPHTNIPHRLLLAIVFKLLLILFKSVVTKKRQYKHSFKNNTMR